MRGLFFWIPMSFALFIVWVMLSGSLSLGTIAIGAILSFALILLSTRLRPNMAYPRRPWACLKLFGIVVYDTYTSAYHVLKQLLLDWRGKTPEIGFVSIPLTLRDPHALALLSCIITYCPGTVWSGLSENDYILRLHVFGLDDEQTWHDIVKNRYERLLMEIFE